MINEVKVEMKKVCLLGAGGQLGTEILNLQKDFDSLNIQAVDRTQLDIKDKEAVADFFEENYFDLLINCAA